METTAPPRQRNPLPCANPDVQLACTRAPRSPPPPPAAPPASARAACTPPWAEAASTRDRPRTAAAHSAPARRAPRAPAVRAPPSPPPRHPPHVRWSAGAPLAPSSDTRTAPPRPAARWYHLMRRRPLATHAPPLSLRCGVCEDACAMHPPLRCLSTSRRTGVTKQETLRLRRVA